jgi:hypothetical protein
VIQTFNDDDELDALLIRHDDLNGELIALLNDPDALIERAARLRIAAMKKEAAEARPV